jgi:hypothetical protein
MRFTEWKLLLLLLERRQMKDVVRCAHIDFFHQQTVINIDFVDLKLLIVCHGLAAAV